MAEMTTAYAFGELGPDETKKVQEHLHTCRHCLELYMDIKVAEDDAENAKNQKVAVLPGLAQAIGKGKKPSASIFTKIVEAISDFFGQGISLKPVATFATVLIVVAAGFILMKYQAGITPFTIEMMVQARTQVGFRGAEPEYQEFQIESGGALKSGDYFRLETTIDKDAYVYVVFLDSLGAINSLEKGLVLAGNVLVLPSTSQWYHLDQNTGSEKIYLLASKNEIENFSDKMESLRTNGVEEIESIFPKVTIRLFTFEHK